MTFVYGGHASFIDLSRPTMAVIKRSLLTGGNIIMLYRETLFIIVNVAILH